MELTFHISADVDKQGNPERAYVTRINDTGQHQWLGDAEFGPFDTWIDLVTWWRRQLSTYCYGLFC